MPERQQPPGGVATTTLPGGLRVVTEAAPAARSAAYGIWVGVGSRDERPAQAGSSHLLEHLLFKGTRRRSALEIAAAIDEVGGESNAFTGKEYTCYYARTLAEDLPLAVDVTTDLVLSTRITAADLDAERNVVLEELAAQEDDPVDQVHEDASALVLSGSPLAASILGSQESLAGLTRAGVSGYYRRRYVPAAMVVAYAGPSPHADVVALAEAAFRSGGALGNDAEPHGPRGVPAGSAELAATGPAPGPARPGADQAVLPARARAAHVRGQVHVRRKPGEQAHLVLALPGLSRHDPRRFALTVLLAGLGGGSSSRLFQEIRERRGLAYSVYSYASSYSDAGLVACYAGCAPNRTDEVLRLIRAEIAEVAANGLTDGEVRRARGQVLGTTALGLEDTGSQMMRVGKGALCHAELLTVDEVLAVTRAVTTADVAAVAAQVLTGRLHLAAVGPFSARKSFDRAVA